jgi:UDP-glucose 4-epimerase
MFHSKSLLITGGTGSFGNAVLRRFLRTEIAEIRVLSRDEKKQDDMRHQYCDDKLKFYIGDVRNPESLRDAMEGVDYVFHAAALKQVPSCEFYPMEAVRTNVVGADNMLTAAIQAGVKNVVVLSTDKAAYPVNAMGMSKGLMEKCAIARSKVAADKGCTVSVTRYGNVMASRGSVIPLFVDQIRKGLPLTVTDPSMTRFMMSLDDAVDLVLYAFQKATPGDLFIQKAPAATIGTLAAAVKSVFNAENPVRVIGTRHGEKLYETLLTREEMSRASEIGNYYRVAADVRDLNYDRYFSEGESRIASIQDYHSHNVRQLDVDEMIALLLKLPYIEEELEKDLVRRTSAAPIAPVAPVAAVPASVSSNGHARPTPESTSRSAHTAPKSMKTVLITGANGFIGRNLATHLKRRDDVRVLEFGRANTDSELEDWVAQADVVFHLAGINRPQTPEEFDHGNVDFTRRVCRCLEAGNRKPQVIFSSSIQAELDNPYGVSKRRAEQILQEFAVKSGSAVAIFRLKNVFGKWCRPNYNSAVATFCHNIAHDLPIQVTDPNRRVDLVHVDDVVAAFLKEMDEPRQRDDALVTSDPIPSYALTLDELVRRIRSFSSMQKTLQIPDFSERFNRQLYATYLSYVDPTRWEYGLDIKSDARGNLAEFIKSPGFGQVFISRTRPGITRGNHFHHVKTEKFMVIAGEGLIRFRHVEGGEVLEYPVKGSDYRVVDIPPGYTHSITNVGDKQMITLFWASEIFDPEHPDTYFLPVDLPADAIVGSAASPAAPANVGR